MSSTLLAFKAQTDAGSAERKRLADRKKAILLLIHGYLTENGYMDTASRLLTEASSAIGKLEVADNVDLDVMMTEYEAYYELRFGKKPKMLRKVKDDEINPRIVASESNSKKSATRKTEPSTSSNIEKLPAVSGAAAGPEAGDENGSNTLGIQGTSVAAGQGGIKGKRSDDHFEERLLKPPPYANDSELKQLAASISREIYQESPNIRFEDIISLEEPKRLLCEAVQLPIRFPTIFTGILRPWRGILLHGPPGTGKTMLAKAVATECQTTFFNISASTLVSKWRGDSEKLVRVLFEMARYHSPSTIFLDEIDSILSSRGGDGGNEHEASRRMKTELLIQMDGVKGASTSQSQLEQVFVMTASNTPWDLDVAILRRLEKRVIVGLPVMEAREAMIRRHLEERSATDVDYKLIAQRTDGFSGADIELLCREAAMMPVRRLMAKINELDEKSSSSQGRSLSSALAPEAPSSSSSAYYQHLQAQPHYSRPTHRGGSSTIKANSVIDVDSLVKSDRVNMNDVLLALSSTRPSSDGNMTKYEAWQSEFGSS